MATHALFLHNITSHFKANREDTNNILRITYITSQDLDFEGHYDLGLGAKGSILISDLETKHHLVLFTFNENSFRQRWRKPLPDMLPYNCQKVINPDNQVLLRNRRGNTTWVFSDNLKLKTKHVGDYGQLMTANRDIVTYSKGGLF